MQSQQKQSEQKRTDGSKKKEEIKGVDTQSDFAPDGSCFHEQVPKAVTTRGLTKENGNTKTTEAPSSARHPSKTFSSLPPPHFFFNQHLYSLHSSIRSKCPLPSIFTFHYLCHPCTFAYCVPSFLNIPFKIHLYQFWTTILTRWASPYVGHISPIYSCRVKRMI